jgi:hypothetical protein
MSEISYRREKWTTTKKVWEQTFEKNAQDIVRAVEFIVYLGADYDIEVERYKQYAYVCMEKQEISEEEIEKLSDSEKSRFLFINFFRETMEVGLTEGKTKEEMIEVIVKGISSVEKPKRNWWSKIVHLFRLWKIKRMIKNMD